MGRLIHKGVIKKILIIFVTAFALNFIWEHLHSALYVHYKGVEITDLILFRATIFDAVFITLISAPFVFVKSLSKHFWIAAFAAFIFAVGLELYALQTSRWAYNSAMPIIPLLGVGLSPAVQLGVTSFIAKFVTDKISSQ